MKFEKFGSGKVNVIFLHGWGADANSFLWTAKFLKKYCLHIATLDGFGKEPPPQDPTILGYCSRLKDYVKKMNLENVVLVGHSFGGRIAIEYASQNKLLGLVLVDSAGIKARFSLRKWLRVKKFKFMKFLVKTKLVKNSKILEGFGSIDYKNSSYQMKQVLLHAINYDQQKLLKKIDCKTLIFWGKNDKDTPTYMAKIFHKKIKNSKLVMVGGEHFSFLENKTQFINNLEYFIDNLGG